MTSVTTPKPRESKLASIAPVRIESKVESTALGTPAHNTRRDNKTDSVANTVLGYHLSNIHQEHGS